MEALLIYSIVMWFLSMLIYSHAVSSGEEITTLELWSVIFAPIAVPIYIGYFIIEEL